MQESVALAVLQNSESALFGIDGVLGAAIGNSRATGGGVAIAVFVADSAAAAAVTALGPLDDGAGNFLDTDVAIVGAIREAALPGGKTWDDTRYDHVKGGTGLVSNTPWVPVKPHVYSRRHTLGCIGTAGIPEGVVPVGLTTLHALARTNPATQFGIYGGAPSPDLDRWRRIDVGHVEIARDQSSECCVDAIGERILRARYDDSMDAAIFELVKADIETYRGDIARLAGPDGQDDEDRDDIAVAGTYQVSYEDVIGPLDASNNQTDPTHPGYQIRMRGAGNGWVKGYVSHLHCIGNVTALLPRLDVAVGNLEFAMRHFTGGLVLTNQASEPFSMPGDSGAVYVNDANQLVGLHFGLASDFGFGHHIDPILAELDVEVVQPGAVGQDVPIPREAGTGVHSATGLQADAMDRFAARVREELAASPKGARLVRLVGRHRSTVLDLINSNRRVALAWHRLGGPTLMRNLMRAAHDREYILPEKINGRSWGEAVNRAFALFSEHGSEELREDLHLHGEPLTLIGGMSFDQAMQTLHAPSSPQPRAEL